jgi:DNA (cytosine-5)-methyltransferase 1
MTDDNTNAATPQKTLRMADLFCGAGGTSEGALQAFRAMGYSVELTAVNPWDIACATHGQNHPDARTLCTSVDALEPSRLFPDGLDLLWASPSCTHHSNALGGRPCEEQSRATGWCVARWAESRKPPVILVENVREFQNWGPLGTNGRPIKSKQGATFRAWVQALRSFGYRVEWRVLCAADYGDPTSRERLIVQAVRGKRRIVWPDPTHAPAHAADMFARLPWRPASDIIDWTLPMRSIYERKKPLAANTLRRIEAGLRKYGSPVLIAMEHGGRPLPIDSPLPTVTCAKGGAFALAYLLPQQSGGQLRPVTDPVPTVSTAGAISLIVEYYGNGGARLISEPLPTVTCTDRFALIHAAGGDVLMRMLKPHELAAAQGFPRGYKFAGNQTEQTKQIGNAVPPGLARAIVAAVWSQKNDVSEILAPFFVREVAAGAPPSRYYRATRWSA